MSKTQGYLFITLGKEYIDECTYLVNTMRKNGDNRPVTLWIHAQDEEYARALNMFDGFIHFDNSLDNKIWQECQTSFEKYCLYPRLFFDKVLPYDETIITDTDMLCQYSTESMWDKLHKQKLNVRMLGRKYDYKWHWGTILEVSKAYGKHVSHVHGGFFYLRRSDFTNKFFTYCREVFFKYDQYKCKRAFRGGRVDEIIFAISHSHFDLAPIEFDDIPIMTFNYSKNIKIPSKLQTEGNQNEELSDYIPFVHMFDKSVGIKFRNLYGKIMNYEKV